MSATKRSTLVGAPTELRGCCWGCEVDRTPGQLENTVAGPVRVSAGDGDEKHKLVRLQRTATVLQPG